VTGLATRTAEKFNVARPDAHDSDPAGPESGRRRRDPVLGAARDRVCAAANLADPLEPGAWLRTCSCTVVVALNIIPFAGIAFLWFIGVLRDRLGQREDRFFATVFFGSGLLFLAMLFVASAMVGALILVFREQPDEFVNAAAFGFARATVYSPINIYMIKMAAVFIVSTSTVAVYTGFSPRWIALLGYVLAAIVLLGGGYMT
jgi:hypothetical protein